MAAHNVPKVTIIPAHLLPNGSRVPAKVQCENCESLISIHMIERHRGSNYCNEMKKWREKQKHSRATRYKNWM